MLKKGLPLCPHCKENANVIKLIIGFKCVFCGKRFFDKREEGQQVLNIK